MSKTLPTNLLGVPSFFKLPKGGKRATGTRWTTLPCTPPPPPAEWGGACIGYRPHEYQLIVDCDGVLDDSGRVIAKDINDRIKALITASPSYIELSYSKHGLHIIYDTPQGIDLPTPLTGANGLKSGRGSCYISSMGEEKGGKIELYYGMNSTSGAFNHYFALTGNARKMSTPAIEPLSKKGLEVIKKLINDSKKAKAPAKKQKAKNKKISLDEIKAALDYIDPDLPYNSWVTIGMALHSFSDDEEALNLWDDWSAGGSKYKGLDDLKTHWKSFNEKENGITIATLFRFAVEGGYKDFSEFDILPNEGIEFPVLVTDSKGNRRPLTSASENVEAILQYHGIALHYNEVTKNMEYSTPTTTWGDFVTSTKQIADLDGLVIPYYQLEKLLTYIAHKHTYNPVRDYLQECWNAYKTYSELTDNNEDFIKKLFDKIKLAADCDYTFSLTLFRKWFVNAVMIAHNTLDKQYAANGVLVWVGKQGIGKSRFLQFLLSGFSQVYGLGGVTLDPSNKDSKMICLNKWIVELGEIGATLRKKRVEELKQFITAPYDRLRLPYDRDTLDYARTTVFYGSVNQEDFLRDSTGNRRYWSINVLDMLECQSMSDEINLVWGQAMAEWKSRTITPWLDGAAIEQMEKINSEHMILPSSVSTLFERLDFTASVDTWSYKTASDYLGMIGMKQENTRSIGKALSHIAEHDSRVKTKKLHGYKAYLLPPKKDIEGEGYFE